jgi:hypothetical protein
MDGMDEHLAVNTLTFPFFFVPFLLFSLHHAVLGDFFCGIAIGLVYYKFREESEGVAHRLAVGLDCGRPGVHKVPQ